ncbi:hypothetical protein [Fictibacillus phosphorivorans]|nr:hypothetical protein [Fictibacillus phosphorivorans]MCM3719097.1 hypothetical protein [Fictibacillus phosphorivorans]MCM3776719.1 hypothetical protein [Fictibacillus phosphorivorans]
MKEYVGPCESCKKDLYCMDGFFQGEISPSGKLYCFSCIKEEKKESNE